MISHNPAYTSADNDYEYITDDTPNNENTFQSEIVQTKAGVR